MSTGPPPTDTQLTRGYADTCPRCGAAFACGVDTAACWCTQLPPIDPARTMALDPHARAALGLPAGTLSGCLCPDCLALVAGVLNDRHDRPPG